jgi:hypothetical protein
MITSRMVIPSQDENIFKLTRVTGRTCTDDVVLIARACAGAGVIANCAESRAARTYQFVQAVLLLLIN